MAMTPTTTDDSLADAGQSPLRLDLTDGVLTAQLMADGRDAGMSYAFYLLHDGKRVDVRRYGPETRFAFPTRATRPGLYAVTAFTRHPDGRIERLRSAPLRVEGPRPAKPRLELPTPVRVESPSELEALIAKGGPARFDMRFEGLEFGMLLAPSRPGGLYVILGGTVPPRDTIELPRFSRYTWAAEFPGTVICIADPTLHYDDKLQLGWYFGLPEQDATDAMARLVLHVARALGVPTDQITAYGSSGGGFAALQLAARLGDGATAIAINPQTDIFKYRIPEGFTRICLRGADEATARERFGSRLSAIAKWQEASARGARCLLVQNDQDRHHHRRHFAPFAAQFGLGSASAELSSDGRIGTLTYSHADGHVAEPREMLQEILAHAGLLNVRKTPAGR